VEAVTTSDPSMLLAVAAVFVLAGLVKGVVGLGLPTVSMALLALMMTPADAAALLIVPSLITNIWQMRPFTALPPLLRRLGPMQIGVCVGTWAGAIAFGAPAGAWASVSLGCVLIVYGGWSFRGARMSVRPATGRWLGPLIGAVTGLVTAATGVFVVPAVPYLQALDLDRDALIQAMGISFTVSTVALAVGLALNGSYSDAAAGASVAMLLPALAGMAAGQRLRKSLSPLWFRRVFLGGLIVLGVHMVVREMLRH
jgi:uncharacterized membrane protein YfcA